MHFEPSLVWTYILKTLGISVTGLHDKNVCSFHKNLPHWLLNLFLFLFLWLKNPTKASSGKRLSLVHSSVLFIMARKSYGQEFEAAKVRKQREISACWCSFPIFHWYSPESHPGKAPPNVYGWVFPPHNDPPQTFWVAHLRQSCRQHSLHHNVYRGCDSILPLNKRSCCSTFSLEVYIVSVWIWANIIAI